MDFRIVVHKESASYDDGADGYRHFHTFNLNLIMSIGGVTVGVCKGYASSPMPVSRSWHTANVTELLMK